MGGDRGYIPGLAMGGEGGRGQKACNVISERAGEKLDFMSRWLCIFMAMAAAAGVVEEC